MAERKFTPEQVAAILVDPRRYKDIADDFGAGVGTIGRIKRRTAYRGVCSDITSHIPKVGRRSLTDEQVVAILLSDRTAPDLAREFGVFHETIRRVRRGLVFADVRPDLPRGRRKQGRPKVKPSINQPVSRPSLWQRFWNWLA